MYEVTILSIFRDSTPYLERYLAQVQSVVSLARSAHVIWLEGDSKDRTLEALERASESLSADVTLVQFDTHGPKWPSIDHAQRWTQLESCWNQCLSYLEPTDIGICVESDLIWDMATLFEEMNIVSDPALRVDVVAPMMFSTADGHFYDTNAFRRDGKNFSPWFPIIPGCNEPYPALVPCETVGGMVVAKGDKLAQAVWKNKCVLHFPEGTDVLADTTRCIYHPE